MSEIDGRAGELIGAGIEQLRADAHRLGVAWNLIPATTAAVSGTSGGEWPASSTYIVQDGSSSVTRAMSLIGRIRGNQRVMTINVPPQGTYIIGYFGEPTAAPQTFDPLRISSRNQTICDIQLNVSETPQPISGTLITVPSTTGQLSFDAWGTFDFDETGLGSVVLVGYLYVDGVQQLPQALFEVTTTTDRCTASQTWSGTVSGTGNHTFELWAEKTGPAGNQRAGASHTTLKVITYE